MNIEFFYDETSAKLNGFCKLSADSNIFAVYGPLGINVARIISCYDSLMIVDIQNKKIYRAKYHNVSGSIFNFFNGIYTSREEQLLCSLCYLFYKNGNCCNMPDKVPGYKFEKKSGYSKISADVYSDGSKVQLKIRIVGNNKASLSGSLNKYSNFENIYLKVPQ